MAGMTDRRCGDSGGGRGSYQIAAPAVPPLAERERPAADPAVVV